MDKISRFIDCYIPTETCNLRCHYCYIAQKRKFNNKICKLEQPLNVIRKALSKERLGGVCLFNLCAGGETLLSEEVLLLIQELLKEGHYIMVVTNGTLTNRFDEMAKFDSELLKRLFFKFSFHYLELIRTNMMDVYFDNINKMREVGCSFTIEITPSDELIPHLEDIKKVCYSKVGALCHITIARNDRKDGKDILSKYSYDEYKEIWGQFDSKLFDYKMDIYDKKMTEFCHAGDWSLYLNINTGVVRQCYCGEILDNIYENIDSQIKYKAIGHNCTQPYCYNGHAFLTLGNIPGMDTITIAETRDRIDKEGKHWLNSKMLEFMSQKLYNNKNKR